MAYDIRKRHNVTISPGNIMIVPGGKVIIFFAAMLMGEKGKEILYPNPGFPIYESAINYTGINILLKNSIKKIVENKIEKEEKEKTKNKWDPID